MSGAPKPYYCRGWRTSHLVEQLEHVYWAWRGAEWFPSEHELCPACCDELVDFLTEPWRNNGLVHFSRELVKE